MKITFPLVAILAACILSGCATGNLDSKEKRCAAYGDVYALYLATAEVREVSKEERAGAAAAAIFLRTYCGWTAPKGVGETLDANGVPVIYPSPLRRHAREDTHPSASEARTRFAVKTLIQRLLSATAMQSFGKPKPI